MKAVVCQNAELEVRDVPEPVPERGHVRIEVLRCGICGSDLHARHGVDHWAELSRRAGVEDAGAYRLHLTRCDRVVHGVLPRLPGVLPAG